VIDEQWYKKIWTLDIKDQSWVEDTGRQVAFIARTLRLAPGMRVLDLACGFGRHSLALAAMGVEVVGVDITKEYVDDARKEAASRGLKAEFVHADIRELSYVGEFDAVLNLADGAIGYLENEEENLKIFDVIARALKKGGRHFMDVCSADHAELCFPKRHWEIGEKSLSLPDFQWDSSSRRMLYSQWEAPFGVPLAKPESIEPATSTRLYSKKEIKAIFRARGMRIVESFSDYSGKCDSPKEIQLMVHSRKVR
jgi:SAM-dependent methyltransferase